MLPNNEVFAGLLKDENAVAGVAVDPNKEGAELVVVDEVNSDGAVVLLNVNDGAEDVAAEPSIVVGRFWPKRPAPLGFCAPPNSPLEAGVL